MPDAPLTLSVMAGLEPGAAGLVLDPRARAELVATLRAKAREIAPLSTFDLGERLLSFVTEVLRKPLADVLEEVWKQRQELRDAAREGKGEPNVENEVALYDHSMAWALHPSVELRLNGQSVATMKFDVDVDLALSGLELVIRNACITSIRTGQIKSTINLSYKSLPLMPAVTRTVKLKGTLDLPLGGINLA